jgi:hypothetical protein
MVDRADPLSHPGSPRVAGPVPNAAAFSRRTAIALATIAILELAWLGWFLVVPLANAPQIPNIVFRRGLLLLQTFPGVVPGTSYRRSMLGSALSELSHVENLPQRLPLLLTAGLIAAAAIGLGDTILGRLRIRGGLGWPVRIALSYGTGAAVLGGLTLIVGRMGWLDPWFIRVGLAGLASPPFIRLALRTFRSRGDHPEGGPPTTSRADPLAWFFILLIAPFVLITLLGSMLPAVDFDVLEYHLQGPKEYFQAGRIEFLPHNVYTNMPFDVEMLHLLGMSVMGDWWWGALAGQLLVAMFGTATAVLIFATAARISTRAAWLAALVYLSTPWVYRFGIIAYVEGPLCFYHIALAWAWLARPAGVETGSGRSWPLLGLLAGAAMGCKYTAMISAVIPFGLLAFADGWRRRSLRPVLAFGLGWAVVMAPWLIKNAIDTGDPVYPLGYRIFHGRGWDAAMEAKWNAAHGPRPFSWRDLGGSIVDVAGRSDWQSPLYAAFAPLALLGSRSRRTAWILWGFAAYIFATWFLLTHRLDRFWLPLLPILAVLAGLGMVWVRHVAWSALASAIVAIGLLTNLVYDSSIMSGFNEWTGDIAFLRRDLPRRLNRPLATLDTALPPDARVLLVGQAAVFHVSHPILYNTVFNDEIIEQLAAGQDVAAIRRALRDRSLSHVYVDWKEIERHRQPGGYGFTDFVTRERFAGWVAAGLLERPIAYGQDQELYRIH